MAQSAFQTTLDEFIDQTYNFGEAFPTRIELVPDGEYKATVSSITYRVFPSNREEGEFAAVVNMMFSINDPEVREATGLDDPKAQLRVNLDTKKGWDGNGNPPLEFGKNKNIYVGRLLEAFGMNDSRPWKWSMFEHEDCYVRVGKPFNPDSPYSDVKAVGRDLEDVQPSNKKK